MLPWEHAAVGYLLYSLLVHFGWQRRPSGLPVLVLGIATVLPDLIDKPLGWWLGWLPSIGLGHSLFFAVPAIVLVWALAGGRYALPLGVGLGTHLVGDVFYKVVVAGRFEYEFMFWPLVEQPASEPAGLFTQIEYWIAEYARFLASPEGMTYLGFELALLGAALVVWIYDGFPGIAPGSFGRGARSTGDY